MQDYGKKLLCPNTLGKYGSISYVHSNLMARLP